MSEATAGYIAPLLASRDKDITPATLGKEHWPAAQGEMAERIRRHPWASTPLGPIETWPQSLMTAVGIMLTTRHPVFIFWGPELICLYNDGYAASLGPEKHPGILGMPAPQAWPEAYPIVAPELQQVMSGGGATWRENNLVPIHRHGRIEEVYWTYSYGPIPDAGAPNGVGGVLTLITETTQAVVSQRENEAALRASEARLTLVLDSTIDVFYAVDSEWRLTVFNAAAERYFGKPRAEVLGRTLMEAFPAFVGSEVERCLRTVVEAQTSKTFEVRSAHRPGRIVQLRASPVPDGGVAAAFTDITDMKRAEEELRAREIRLRLALAAGQLGEWELDLESDTSVRAFRHDQIFGYDQPVENWGFETFIGHVLPEDRQHVEETFRVAAETGAGWHFECRIRRINDGEIRWIAASGEPQFAPDGRVTKIFGLVGDITERKRAEEHQQLLINELNHRVKNTLATVQSIASQTLRNAETAAEAKDALEGRLIALSGAHDVLTRENWEGADLFDIVEQAVAAYSSRGEDRLHLRGPKLRVSPRMALALAMALQELATNAVKYGALSNATGEITVTWDVQRDASSARLHLRWKESGGPPVQAPTRRGFGSRLIERSLAQDLSGRVQIAFHCTGVVCTVDAPLV